MTQLLLWPRMHSFGAIMAFACLYGWFGSCESRLSDAPNPRKDRPLTSSFSRARRVRLASRTVLRSTVRHQRSRDK